MTEEIKNSITETELTADALEQVSGGKDNGGFAHKPRAKAGCQIYQIKHGDTLSSLWNSGQQVFYRERTIQVNAYHTVLGTICVSIIDGLAGSFCGRTH